MESVKVFEAITDLNKNMNDGFSACYEKIDNKFDTCDRRLGRVETIIAVKKALCEKDQKNKDYWKWIIRSLSVAGLGSLIAIAASIFLKLIIFGSKLP